MAWASKKQYAIMMNSEEGKDLAEQLPDLEQDDFNVKFGELLGKGGTYSEEDEDTKNLFENFDVASEEETQKMFGELPDGYVDVRDDDSYENKLKKGRESLNEFDMPKDEGWEEFDLGEKSFIKNKDTDNEMFIQYNGEDVEGYPEYVAGYMENGDYITKKFSNLSDAKSFVDTYEINKNINNDLNDDDYKELKGQMYFQDENGWTNNGKTLPNLTDEQLKERLEKASGGGKFKNVMIESYKGDNIVDIVMEDSDGQLVYGTYDRNTGFTKLEPQGRSAKKSGGTYSVFRENAKIRR